MIQNSEAYMNRKSRDARARSLKASGFKVRRSSIRNQQLHPQYVADYTYELTAQERGFGNTIYRTLFPVLYLVHWTDSADPIDLY